MTEPDSGQAADLSSPDRGRRRDLRRQIAVGVVAGVSLIAVFVVAMYLLVQAGLWLLSQVPSLIT